ncbi:SpoIIE family protein phosphatase [Streptomyces sp. NPDC003480]
MAVVIGDVVGHDLHAAAAMASTRTLLCARLFHLRAPPSAVPRPARPHPAGRHRQLSHHRQPGAHRTRRVRAEVALEHRGPCPTASDQPRPAGGIPVRRARTTAERRQRAAPTPTTPTPCAGTATVIFFTDGLIAHPSHPTDESLDARCGPRPASPWPACS